MKSHELVLKIHLSIKKQKFFLFFFHEINSKSGKTLKSVNCSFHWASDFQNDWDVNSYATVSIDKCRNFFFLSYFSTSEDRMSHVLGVLQIYYLLSCAGG